MTPFNRTFFALYSAVFMSSMGLGILSPILPAYVDSFAASSFVLGIVFGVYSAARTLFMPPVGILSDRFGRRPFILSGLLLFTVVSPLYAVAANLFQLMLVRFLQGIAAAMLMPVAMSAIGDLSPRGKEGFVMGSFTSAFFAGLGFGPLIGGYMSDKHSITAAFYSMGILSLLALLFTIVALPRELSGKGGERPEECPSLSSPRPGSLRPSSGQAGQGGGKGEEGSMWTDRALLGLLFFRFTRAVGIGLVWVIMPLIAVKSLGISAFQIGILLSANTFITTLLQSPVGYLSDKVGHRKFLTAGSGLACAALAFIAWARDFNGLLYASVALGLAGALIVPAGSALAVSLGRSRGMGRTMGLYNSSLSLGTMLGPMIGGALLDLASVRAVFVSGSVLGLLGWVAVIIMFPSKNTE
jgi:MFS family permease